MVSARSSRLSDWMLANALLLIGAGALVVGAGIWFSAGVPVIRANQFGERPDVVHVSASIVYDCEGKSCSPKSYFASYVVNGVPEQHVLIAEDSWRQLPSTVTLAVDPEHPREPRLLGPGNTRKLVITIGEVALAVLGAGSCFYGWHRQRRSAAKQPGFLNDSWE